MALLDHFHPPLSIQRHWESFHTTWATAIADSLNQDWLPEGYFAEEQLHPTARIEIDVVTSRSANLHNETMALIERGMDFSMGGPTELYAVAYRPLRRAHSDQIEIWPQTVSVGMPLPELPLWIGPELVVPVNLDSTYS